MKQIIPIFLAFTLISTTSCSAKKQKQARDIQAVDIIAQLDKGKNIYLDSCIIWGDLDFTKLRNQNKIAPGLMQIFVNASVTFNNCVFIGKVKTFEANPNVNVMFERNLSFVNCDFRSDVDFTEIVVRGNAYFTGSVFRAKVSLQGAYFWHKKVFFNQVNFEGDALFQNTVFAGDVNFLHSVFSSSAMFQKARVGGMMFFGNVKFNDYVDFSYSRATESIFMYAEFKGRHDFSYSDINPNGLPDTIINK